MVARKKEPIPERFESVEAAGDFWDNHSLADYADQTKTVDMDFQISKRTRYIAVPEKIYKKLVQKAHEKHRSVREMVFGLAK